MSEFSLYNSLSRSVEPVVPSAEDNVLGLYCCGPTVYAKAHIGNFRTFISQDVLRRSLQLAGFGVRHVRNLTDVDDKTIAISRQEGRPLAEVTEGWTRAFGQDCEKLNLLPPDVEPKATEHVAEQIDMIARLVEKGHAYAAEDGSVYFRVSSFGEYGKLSGLKERELSSSGRARVDSDEYERDSMADFALWKSRKETDGDVYWDSPWGPGRPAWHIECSAMAVKYLQGRLDIHSGGVDLLFPHHENEIAQSECACGSPFFRLWVHCAHLFVEGEKMSKSLGNLYTIDDLEAKGVAPVVARYALSSGHYRHAINFNFDAVHAAASALRRLRKASDELLQAAGQERAPLMDAIGRGRHAGRPWGPFAPAWEGLANDLNTPACLGQIFNALKQFDAAGPPAGEAETLCVAFHKLVYALGLRLEEVETGRPKAEAPPEVAGLAERRWQAKLAKDFAAADALREEIQAKGWKILDRRDGFELEPLSQPRA